MSDSAENPIAETEPPAPKLDLAQPRVVAMLFGAVPYTWTFRRIGREDWERFFRSFDTETVAILGEQVETFEIETGIVELARTCVTKVEGYKLPDPLPANWRAMLPHGHLKAFASVLRDVHMTPPEETPMALSELIEVSLDCTWSGTAWRGLVHRFRPATLKEQRKFNRACGTYRIAGNDRGSRTIFPARQALMMDFYDELIESVDAAYVVNGEPLNSIDRIRREMDCSHKVAAIQAMLNAGGSGVVASAKKEDDGAQ